MTRRKLIRKKMTTLFLATVLGVPNQAQAVDQATASAIANVAFTIAEDLLVDNSANPPLAVAMANRELIIKLHERLDLIEGNLTRIMIKLAKLPAELDRSNLEAQEYALGTRIASVGSNLFTAMQNFERDRQTFAKDPLRLNKLSQNFSDALIGYYSDVAFYSGDFALRRYTAKSTGALTLVSAAYIELAALIEIERRFDGSDAAIETSASKYLGYFDGILDGDDPISLEALINRTRHSIMTAARSEFDWAPKFDPSTLGTVHGDVEFENVCAVMETGFWSDDRAFISEHSGKSFDRLLWTGLSRQTEYTLKFKQVDTIGDVPVLAPRISSKISKQLDTAPGHTIAGLQNTDNCFLISPDYVPSVPEMCDGRSCDYDRYLNKQGKFHFKATPFDNKLKSPLQNIKDELQLLAYLESIKKSVLLAKNRMQDVINGDRSKFQVGFFSEVGNLGTNDALRLVREIDQAERIAQIRGVEEEMRSLRLEIGTIIERQNEQIKMEFAKATKAAKTVRLLSLIKAGSILAHEYYFDNLNPSKSESAAMQEAAEEVVFAMSSEADRSPASKKVESRLAGILDHLAWWAGHTNATLQISRMNAAREKIENSIPFGQVVQYDLYTRGTSFLGYYRSGQPQILPNRAIYHSTVSITGKAK